VTEELARGLRSPAAGARLNATLAGASRAANAFQRLGEQLRAQRGDIAATVLNSRAVLDELATRDGDVRGLAQDAAATLRAAGASRAAVRATFARVPRTLANARATLNAARPLARRATPLATATARASAPLARALRAAPATLADAAAVLRAAPAVRAAATPALRSLPRTLAAARPAAELLGPVLADLVPVARFLGPRSATAAAWFSNTADLGSNGDAKGRWARFFVLFEGPTALGAPGDPPGNSYTAPGDAAANRAYAAGGYPRLLPYGPALGSGGTAARSDRP
jgi:ABC-type transporter Mla subunit MlaD